MKSTRQSELPIYTEDQEQRESWFDTAAQELGLTFGSGWPDAFGDLLRNLPSLQNSNIRTLALFSGGGGLDIGFHDAGFKIIECNEINKKFAKTLEENTQPERRLDGANVACCDIKDYHPELEDIDFIIGGPPCQSFSAAGARAAGVNGTTDERGNLFLEYARLLDTLSPKGFLFENVYRIVGAQNGTAWKAITKTFSDLGYKLHWRIIDSSDYGVPQFRERLFIVGLKDGIYEFPEPSHGPDSVSNRKYYSASVAVQGADASDVRNGLGGRHGHLLEEIPPGLNYSYFTEKMGHPYPRFGWRSKFSDYLYKADPDTPVRTIKAQGGQYTGPFSWENRVFSIAELKRLQTFPDDYVLVGKRQDAIHQLGNSVPPQLARILALSILQEVFKVDLPFRIKTMPAERQLNFRKRKSSLTKVYAEKAKEAINKIKATPSRAPLPKQKTKYYAFTNSTLLFEETSRKTSGCYKSTSRYSADKWKITIEGDQRSGAKHRIVVRLSDELFSTAKTKKIVIETHDDRFESIAAGWRALESLLPEYTSKEDLIQLFGYYQYKRKFLCDVELVHKSLKESMQWAIWAKITSGLVVGSALSKEELEMTLEAPIEEIRSTLVRMKSIGFEIRNHRTNSQIPKGHYLIPYNFPTLTTRSLQRHTVL